MAKDTKKPEKNEKAKKAPAPKVARPPGLVSIVHLDHGTAHCDPEQLDAMRSEGWEEQAAPKKKGDDSKEDENDDSKEDDKDDNAAT
jgi:hypothetical protein